MIPVLLAAVAVYITGALPWQRVDEAPAEKTGAATDGVSVTAWVAAGVPQPAARAVIMVVPTQPATKFTVPLVEFIVLPADTLALSSEYVIVVDAVAEYMTEPEPLHLLEDEPAANTGVGTVGVKLTVCVAYKKPGQPFDTAVIVEGPAQLAT